MTPKEVEERINEMFEENYEALRLEGGHAITEDVKQSALKQVIAYYRKLRDVAEKVTETEVKLTLPNQETPAGHKFNIEGIVDIVREDDEVWMYDLKTHDPKYIKKHPQFYESQLNVYAHIYENLRGNTLDHTAIISTALPDNVKTALSLDDEQALDRAFASWEPIIEINYAHEKVEQTIAEFAQVVDKIEGHCFAAPEAKTLKEKVAGPNVQFATYVCRNCDARFSCESFREYVRQTGAKHEAFLKYLEDTGDDIANEDRINTNLAHDMKNENEIGV
jgi:hypothetical protein